MKKKIIVGYCIAIILSVLIVPWKIDWHNKWYSAKISKGYSFVFSPPVPAATIDLSRMLLEWVIITAVACIIYVMRDKIFGNNKNIWSLMKNLGKKQVKNTGK